MCRERRDLDAGPFGVGATMMIAVPAAQARLTCAAPEAPTLMGATKLASFNVAKGEIETLPTGLLSKETSDGQVATRSKYK